VWQGELEGGRRLDAGYYQDEFVQSQLRVTGSGLETVPLAGSDGLVRAWIPGRTSLVFTHSSERGTPYLRAHDALERLPPYERYAALAAMRGGEDLQLEEGWIVLTCSGRNFGPCAYVNSHLAGAAMTDIMRLEASTPDDAFYVLAFLVSQTGQALIRRDPAGSVINHLAPKDLERLLVPLLPDEFQAAVVEAMRRAVSAAHEAALSMVEVDRRLRIELDLGEPRPATWPAAAEGPRVATRLHGQLGLRVDAEFFSERHEQARLSVERGLCDRLDEAADLLILGRYKRFYVEPPYGTPILSSGQLHQFRPVAMKRISDRSFRDPDVYRLANGMSLIACDGRAEGDLGRPGYVSSLWDGWMASNHVMRVIPREGIHPGYLHAALRLQEVQVQLKSVATGSVVDALDAENCGPVLIPRLDEETESEIGTAVTGAWERWAEAARLDGKAANLFEDGLQLAHDKRVGQKAA
jgi:hypothetical protein